MRRRVRVLLLVPAIVLVLGVLVVPVAQIIGSSFGDGAASYQRALDDTLLLRSFVVTLVLTLLTVGFTVLLGYPLAYFLASMRSRRAAFAMVLVLVPLWTSITVKTFAFILILGRQGFINELLTGSGLVSDPLPLLYNAVGVVAGLVHIGLPLLVLPLYATMRTIDRSLMQAAQSLGAKPIRAFWETFFPLSLPGMASGCVLVFMTTIGAYVTPALLGSSGENMVVQFIVRQVNVFFDLPYAAAMTLGLLVLTVVSLVIAGRWIGFHRLFTHRGGL